MSESRTLFIQQKLFEVFRDSLPKQKFGHMNRVSKTKSELGVCENRSY